MKETNFLYICSSALCSSEGVHSNFDATVNIIIMASSFAPPKLADFILTERLGSGTYATVYKAYRKVLHSLQTELASY